MGNVEKVYNAHDRHVPQSADEPFVTPGFLPTAPGLVSVADAASGVRESGKVVVKDLLELQPWPPMPSS